MTVLTHAPTPQMAPGTWRAGRLPNGRRVVLAACPACGTIASLSGHAVDAAGTMSPSVVCPACTFHDVVRLAGWEPD